MIRIIFAAALTAATALAADLSNNLENATAGVESASAARRLAGGFATDTAPHTLNSVTLLIANPVAGQALVHIYRDGGLEPGALVATLSSPDTYSASLAPTVFRGAAALEANTEYWVVLEPTDGEFSWAWSTDNTGAGEGFRGTWGVSEDATFWWTQDIYPVQMGIVVDLCVADFDGNGSLNIFDFLAYQTAFGDEDPSADIAPPFGTLNVFDFLAYQAAFGNGC